MIDRYSPSYVQTHSDAARISANAQMASATARFDFCSFVRAIFPLVSPGGSLHWNWHLEAIAYDLMRVYRGKIRRLIITVPPRSLKSILASVAFPAFVLGHDPTKRFMCASYSDELATFHSKQCRDVVRSPIYRRVFPQTLIRSGHDSSNEFATTKGGYRLATSVGGSLTGRGGNIIVIDDPLKSQDAHSEVARKRVIEWFSSTVLTRRDNKIDDAIILVMQRLHVEDLAGYLLDRGGWHHLNLPAIAETEEEVPIGLGKRHRRMVGEVLHPAREPQSVLGEIKAEMGALTFAAQYQQEPVLSEGNLVKWSWFKFYDANPQPTTNDKIVISWDTALTERELSSYSVGIVFLVRNETVYILDLVRGRFEFPELRQKAFELHRRWKITNRSELLIEDRGSGTGLIQEFKSQHIHPLGIIPKGEKTMRMNSQTFRILAGSVFLPRHASWLDEFRKEVCAFPGGRYDDQVDALSQALNHIFEPRPRATWGTYIGAC